MLRIDADELEIRVMELYSNQNTATESHITWDPLYINYQINSNSQCGSGIIWFLPIYHNLRNMRFGQDHCPQRNLFGRINSAQYSTLQKDRDTSGTRRYRARSDKCPSLIFKRSDLRLCVTEDLVK
jgi:hypothetical protein